MNKGQFTKGYRPHNFVGKCRSGKGCWHIYKNPTNYWLGKKRSKETKKKISLKLKGRIVTQETRGKMSLGHKGRKLSEEHKEKLRKAMLGKHNGPERFPFTNTLIELKLQDWLKKQGILFETNYPILGRPDIFIKPNICIFADGCYWHKCPECGFEDKVKTEKDLRITRELQTQGYTVIRIWEHDINKNQLSSLNNLPN